MLFKAIALFVIFFLVRNAYRSWTLFKKLQENQKNKSQQGTNSKNHSKNSKDDAIDAEFTVVDK